MRARLLEALPLLIVAALFAFVTGTMTLPVLVFVGLALAIPLAGYVDAPPFAQRAALLVVVLMSTLGGGLTLLGPATIDHLRPSETWGVVATTGILLCLARRFFREPEGGVRVDFVLVTLAFVACGQRRIGAPYVVAVVSFVAAIIVVIRSRDAQASWSVVERHAPAALGGMVVLAAALATTGMVALPRLARLTQRQFDRYVLPAAPTHVGFTDHLGTGGPDPVLESDTLVMRIYGPPVDYLRGRVYNTFTRRWWESAMLTPPTLLPSPIAQQRAPGVTEIRALGPLLQHDGGARYFVPIGARQIATGGGAVSVDVFGAMGPEVGTEATRISFVVGEAEYAVAPPGDAELTVPIALRGVLEPIALEWTRGALTPRAKLAALEEHLSHDFSYTLEPAPLSPEHPLVTFLRSSHRGHCELFATAMALLARTVGVPTRVVGGFRVAEHNAFGGYDVVREKNAHAWVEGWAAGSGADARDQWRTYDPTPPTEANLRREPSTLAAFADVIPALWDRALDVLGRASLWQFGVVLGVAVALLTAVRLLRARRERRKLEALSAADGSPLPYFVRLEDALARSGYPRPANEALERYAQRLETADVSLSAAARVVLEYSALRYGGVGDPSVVAARAEACALAIAERTPASGPTP
jgi:transglutaminase-like putative cysteine protease